MASAAPPLAAPRPARARPDEGPPPPAPPSAGEGRWPRWAVLAVAAVLGLVAATSLLTHPLPSDDPLFLSPHENVRWELAGQWVDTGRPVYELPAFDRLPEDIAPALTPRDASLVDGQVVPKDFPYAVALVALLRAVAPEVALLLTLASALAVLVLVALLARELTRSPLAAVVATALVGTSTAFWAGSVGRIETGGVTAALVLGGVLALCRGRRRAEAEDEVPLRLLLVAGACFGLAVGFHHGAAVLVAGVTLAFAVLSPRPVRTALAVGGAAGVALLPLLVYNAWLFDSPLRTGYGAASAFYDGAEQRSSGSVFRFDLESLAGHVRRYWLRPEVVLVVVAAALGARALLRRSAAAARPLLLALAVGALPYLAFMGARPLFGSQEFALNASFLRYGLPVFAVLAVLAGAAVLARSVGVRRAVLAGAAVAVAVAVTTTVQGRLGPRGLSDEFTYSGDQTERLFEVVPEDGIVISGKQDKFLWPERATLTAAYLVQRQQRPGEYLGDLVPDPDRLADVVIRLVLAGETVFLWDPGRWFASDPEKLPELDVRLLAAGVWRADEPLPGLSSFRAATPPPG